MFIEFMNIKAIPINSTSIQSEKHIQEVNGKIVKDIELTEYEKNGNIIVKGHYNKKPIYYKKRITPKFRNKHVRFNIGKIKIPNKINRTPTPFIKEEYNINKKQSIKNKIATIEKINKQIKTRKRRGK
jgi:hypothetical protein